MVRLGRTSGELQAVIRTCARDFMWDRETIDAKARELLARAEEVRARAETVQDNSLRAQMLKMAASYVKMAAELKNMRKSGSE